MNRTEGNNLMNLMTVLMPTGKQQGPSVSVDAWDREELREHIVLAYELGRTILINDSEVLPGDSLPF